MGADVVVSALESRLQQVAAETAAEAGLDVPTFYYEHERRGSQLLHHRHIHHIDSGLVDEIDTQPTFPQRNDRIERPIHSLTHRNDISAAGGRLP